ncbi:hypothetical protein GCM10022250_11020 [Flavobacterium chungbukense]|uniref:Uncharacterized protein n=1 Tax=Flavobacterium chungbukense TaxID=877464 RepID=A0ABP7XT87_9FLAO
MNKILSYFSINEKFVKNRLKVVHELLFIQYTCIYPKKSATIKRTICHFEEREITLETPQNKSPIFGEQRV